MALEFTLTDSDENPQPQCVVFAQDSMKSKNLKHDLETKCSALRDKPQDIFEGKLFRLK